MAEEKKKPDEEIPTPKPEGDEIDKKIDEEIEAEKPKKEEEEGEAPKKEPPKPEKKEEEAGKGEEEEKHEPRLAIEEEEEDEEEKEERKPERTPRMMPVYKLRIAEKKWEKEKEGLQRTIDDLNEKIASKAGIDKEREIEEFAKEHKMDPEVLKGLVRLVQPTGGVISDKMQEDVKKLKEDQEWDRQRKIFDGDFKKTIVPLLEEDKVPQEKREELKTLFGKLAFTRKYVSYKLDDLYFSLKRKGELNEFLPAEKGKKSAEESRGGARGGVTGEKGILDMSDEEFDEWEKEREEESKRGGLEIRRGGRSIIV